MFKNNDANALQASLIEAEEKIKALEVALSLKEEELKSRILEKRNLTDKVTNLQTSFETQNESFQTRSTSDGLEGDALEFYRNFIKVNAFKVLSSQMYEYLLAKKQNWKNFGLR